MATPRVAAPFSRKSRDMAATRGQFWRGEVSRIGHVATTRCSCGVTVQASHLAAHQADLMRCRRVA